MPEAPIGFDESTPPEQLTGMSPSIEVAPLSVIFQPSPTSAKPRFSIHIGSYQLKRTYHSTTSKSLRGLVTPAWRYTSAAQSCPPCGFTGSRPGNQPSSV